MILAHYTHHYTRVECMLIVNYVNIKLHSKLLVEISFEVISIIYHAENVHRQGMAQCYMSTGFTRTYTPILVY